MKYYFKLQYLRLQRTLSELGIAAPLGIFLGIVIFIAISKYLFYKLDFANYIYVFFAIISLLNLSDIKHVDKIKAIFSAKDYRKIRFIENLALSLPFVFYLVYESQHLMAASVLSIAVPLTFFESNLIKGVKIPTPFKKWPFEFIMGFRKTFPLLLLSFVLCIIGVQVDNFNLSLFCLGLVFLIAMTFYFKPEKIYFTWIHTRNANGFLKHKVLLAFLCVSIMSLPFLLLLLLSFPSNYLWILAIQMLGYVFLLSMIFAKYSAYPNEMNVPQGLLYGLSLWFPPMLLFVIPIFYFKSVRQLKQILE